MPRRKVTPALEPVTINVEDMQTLISEALQTRGDRTMRYPALLNRLAQTLLRPMMDAALAAMVTAEHVEVHTDPMGNIIHGHHLPGDE
jgi:hypothetical protein